AHSPAATTASAAVRHAYDVRAPTAPHSRRSAPSGARRHDNTEPATRPRTRLRMRRLTVAKRARAGQGCAEGDRLPRRMSITPETARSLRRELVRWYARARRDLPWRRTKDPYAVWISEA